MNEDELMKTQLEHSREQDAFSQVTDDDATYFTQQKEKSDLTRWQQDLTDDLELLRHDFLREKWSVDGNKWVKETRIILRKINGETKRFRKKEKSMVNEYGTYKIISLIKRYLTRNLMMSSLDETIIFRMMKGLVLTLVQNLGNNFAEYEINKYDLSLIVKMVKDSVEPTLYRAYKNGERQYLNTINKRVEAFTEHAEPQNKKGFMGVNFGG